MNICFIIGILFTCWTRLACKKSQHTNIWMEIQRILSVSLFIYNYTSICYIHAPMAMMIITANIIQVYNPFFDMIETGNTSDFGGQLAYTSYSFTFNNQA